MYPKLICSLFFQENGPKHEVEELPLTEFVFGMIKIRLPEFDCISEGERGVSHAEKYLTLRYNKNRITRRSSQKEYKSFLPENSSPFSSSSRSRGKTGARKCNEIESVRIGSDMLESGICSAEVVKNEMEIIYDD